MKSTDKKIYKVVFAKNFKIGYWAFALINNRLAEISYDDKNEKMVVCGHCYVKKGEYKTKREQKMILEDTKIRKFTWRNKKYKKVD